MDSKGDNVGTTRPQTATPSYAQPRNVQRKQPPLLERVRAFVEQFGSNHGASPGRDRGVGKGYYESQAVSMASMSMGRNASGAEPLGKTRRRTEEKRALSTKAARAGGSGSAGTKQKRQVREPTPLGIDDKAIRNIRERMHRATQGLPITPLPARLVERFSTKDSILDAPADQAEWNAMTWLGLLKVSRCALCAVEFPADALVTSVSLHAVRRLRHSFVMQRQRCEKPATTKDEASGEFANGETGRAAVPQQQGQHQPPFTGAVARHPLATPEEGDICAATRLYSAAKVCRFCSQFFGVFLGARFDEKRPMGKVSSSPVQHTEQGKASRSSSAVRHGGGGTAAPLGLPLRDQEVPKTADGEYSTDSDAEEEHIEMDAESCSSRERDAPEPSSPKSPARHQRSSSSSGGSPPSSRSSSESAHSSCKIRSATVPASAAKTSTVTALREPQHPVHATRASLLRRTHHAMRERQQQLQNQAAIDEADVAQRKVSITQRLRIEPVSANFTLGPSADSDASADEPNPAPHAPRLDSKAQVRTQGTAADREQVPDPPAAAEKRSNVVKMPDAGVQSPGRDSIRVLVLCCYSYNQRVSLPVAQLHIAKKLASWCEQLLVPTFNGDQHHATLFQSTANVQLLVNDQVVHEAVRHFLTACADEQAAPLILFLGASGHMRGTDVGLFTTAASSPAAAPAPVQGRALQQGMRKQRTRLETEAARRRQAASLNPLSCSLSAQDRGSSPASEKHDFISLKWIDGLCRDLNISSPLLVLDGAAAAPLAVATERIWVVHPRSNLLCVPRDVAVASAAQKQVESGGFFGVPCGSVVASFFRRLLEDDGFGALFDAAEHPVSLGDVTSHSSSPWPVALRATEASLFSSSPQAPFFVTVPRCEAKVTVGLPPRHSGVTNEGAPRRDTTEALSTWHLSFPPKSVPIEMHCLRPKNATSAASLYGRHAVALGLEEDFAVLDAMADQVASAFAVRLDARHTVQRMSDRFEQVALWGAVDETLRERGVESAGLTFHIQCSLSGHIVITLSSPTVALVQQAAGALIHSRDELRQRGWWVLDVGYILAGAPSERAVTFALRDLLDASVVVVDVHVP